MKKLWICLLAAAATLAAQQFTSPAAETSVTVAGTTVKVNYFAPSMHQREIFGKLVPYGKVWRAGANQATILHTDGDITLGGIVVPKGDYSLYVLPTEQEWTLIINKETGQWGINRDGSTTEDPAQDLGRAKMDLRQSRPVETFKISLTPAGPKGGKLQLEWENTVASVAFTVK